MKQIEFEEKLFELIKEYTRSDLTGIMIRDLEIQIGKNMLPKISLNGLLIEKE